jgi:hypothetical protein
MQHHAAKGSHNHQGLAKQQVPAKTWKASDDDDDVNQRQGGYDQEELTLFQDSVAR